MAEIYDLLTGAPQTATEIRMADAERKKARGSILALATDAANAEWAAPAVGRWSLLANQTDYPTDPDFRLDEAKLKDLTAGLEQTPSTIEAFAGARSEAHALAIRQSLVSYEASLRRLGYWGWGGFGARMLAAVTDPAELLAEGLTVGAVAPATKGRRLTRIAKAAAAGAAAEGGFEAVRAQGNPDRDYVDVGLALGGAFALSAGLGGLLTAADAAGAARGMRRVQKIVEAQDAADAANAARRAGSKTGAPLADPPLDRGLGAALRGELDDVPTDADLDWQDTVLADPSKASDAPGVYTSVRPGAAGRVLAGENPRMRQASRAIFRDSLQPEGTKAVSSGTEGVQLLSDNAYTRYNRVLYQAQRDWLKGNKVNLWNFLKTGPELLKFNDEVAYAIRRMGTDAFEEFPEPIRRVATAHSEMMKDILNRAKKAGVPGFEDVAENMAYLRRSWSAAKIDDMIGKAGKGNTVTAITNAIRKTAPDLDDLSARVWARAIVNNTIAREFNTEIDLHNALMLVNKDETRKFLMAAVGEELTEADVATVLGKAFPDVEAVPARARRRITLDETDFTDFTDAATGKVTRVRMEDLLDNDAPGLFYKYVREVYGLIADHNMRKGLGKFNPETGEVDVPSWDDLKAEWRAWRDTSVPYGQRAKYERDIQRLEVGRNFLLGRPMSRMPKPAMEWLARVRKFAYARVGGLFALAQIPEIGSAMGQAGFRASVESIPALKVLWQNALKGQMSDGLLMDIQAMAEIPYMLARRGQLGRWMDTAADAADVAAGRSDDVLNLMVSGTNRISGLSRVNTALDMFAMTSALQRIARDAMLDRAPSARRLAELGLDRNDWAAIADQFRKHGAWEKGTLGKRLARIHLEKWDPQTAARLTIGINKWAAQAIQKNNVGMLMTWMTSDWAKMLLQFRTFTLGSYENHLLRGIYHRDFATGSAFMLMSAFGAATYIAAQYVKVTGRPDAAAELKKRLSAAEIAKGAFQRAGWSALFPAAIDSGMYALGLDPAFAYGRMSGAPTDALFGSPSMDLLSTSMRALRGVSGPLNPLADYRYSQADMRAQTSLIPLQNAVGVQNFLNYLPHALGLPKTSTTPGD